MKPPPDIRLKNGVPHIKHEISFLLSEGYALKDQYGQMLVARKVLVTHWPFEAKAFVQLIGRLSNGGATRSVRYNLRGYKYPPCPEWLLDLLREAGFRETVQA